MYICVGFKELLLLLILNEPRLPASRIVGSCPGIDPCKKVHIVTLRPERRVSKPTWYRIGSTKLHPGRQSGTGVWDLALRGLGFGCVGE